MVEQNLRLEESFALHGIGEEEAPILLTAFPSTGANAQPDPDMTCWITYRLPLGEFMLESEQSYQEGDALHIDGASPTPVRQPLDALLIIGWTAENDSECVLVVERGHRLLPFVVYAVSSVIVSILLVERIHGLEAIRIRDSLREMELLKAELLGTVSHVLQRLLPLSRSVFQNSSLVALLSRCRSSILTEPLLQASRSSSLTSAACARSWTTCSRTL